MSFQQKNVQNKVLKNYFKTSVVTTGMKEYSYDIKKSIFFFVQ